jgi:NAD(P)-dependent dehydrogenase (short-subunit alcohol dehydrogenase family)
MVAPDLSSIQAELLALQAFPTAAHKKRNLWSRTRLSLNIALMPTYEDLRDQTVVITGGANGIGAAMVRAFHAQQSHVFFCDLDSSAGKALVRDLSNAVTFNRVDLTRESEVSRWIKAVSKQTKTINVLINNAARDPRIPLSKMSAADWDNLFATNLRAYFLTAHASVPHMIPGSSIINFSSVTFHNAPAAMSAYVATKAGAIGFTRSLARELGPRRIRVNVISPGWTMTARQLKEYVNAAARKLIRQSQCIPDFLQPEDIAEVALFLASDASRAITGQEILADRGWAHS